MERNVFKKVFTYTFMTKFVFITSFITKVRKKSSMHYFILF